jgi:hypothetical protein
MSSRVTPFAAATSRRIALSVPIRSRLVIGHRHAVMLLRRLGLQDDVAADLVTFA